MIVGFTGTRDGPTPRQHATMKRVLSALPITRFVHGAEAHSDTFAHYIVRAAHGAIPIELHPCDIRGTRSHLVSGNYPYDIIFPELPPLERNKIIVSRVSGLIATPKSSEEIRSGTWATIRYARKIFCPVYIIEPSGEFVRDQLTYDTWIKPL